MNQVVAIRCFVSTYRAISVEDKSTLRVGDPIGPPQTIVVGKEGLPVQGTASTGMHMVHGPTPGALNMGTREVGIIRAKKAVTLADR